MSKNSERNNVLLVAITRLGDLLQMSPTIVGLKTENPQARVTVLVDKQFAQVCNHIPGIDEVFIIDLGMLCRCMAREGEGMIEAFSYVDDVVNELRARKFDYCLNMSNSSYTALLIKLLNVSENRGWLSDAEGFRLMADPWAMLFAAFVYHSNRDYNSLNLVDIFRSAAEVRQHPNQLCFTVNEAGREFVQEFLQSVPSGRPVICVQAGASQGKRQWAPRHFAQLVRLLVEELQAIVVFTGAKSEAGIVDEIQQVYSHPHAISAVGQTNFEQLGALLERADVLITGDTGPMHLSVAVGTPVVALFLASALVFETGPYSEGNFVLQPQISCSPCNPNYPCAKTDCHEQITPQLVMHLTKLRLNTPRGKEAELVLSPEIADPRNVVVYRSAFDQDGYLDFFPINGLSARGGQPAGYFEAARAAYRALWKEEFAELPCSQPRAPIPAVEHPIVQGLRHTIELCRHGCNYLEELRLLVANPRTPGHLLGEIDRKIQAIDKTIEEVSLTYPMLGVLVRVFVAERENLRGDDPLLLASETETLYKSLERRSERFGQLFIHYLSQYRAFV